MTNVTKVVDATSADDFLVALCRAALQAGAVHDAQFCAFVCLSVCLSACHTHILSYDDWTCPEVFSPPPFATILVLSYTYIGETPTGLPSTGL